MLCCVVLCFFSGVELSCVANNDGSREWGGVGMVWCWQCSCPQSLKVSSVEAISCGIEGDWFERMKTEYEYLGIGTYVTVLYVCQVELLQESCKTNPIETPSSH